MATTWRKESRWSNIKHVIDAHHLVRVVLFVVDPAIAHDRRLLWRSGKPVHTDSAYVTEFIDEAALPVHVHVAVVKKCGAEVDARKG